MVRYMKNTKFNTKFNKTKVNYIQVTDLDISQFT